MEINSRILDVFVIWDVHKYKKCAEERKTFLFRKWVKSIAKRESED